LLFWHIGWFQRARYTMVGRTRVDDMDKVKSNVSYECRKCGAKGTLAKSVESIDLNEIKKLPCGCPAENGIFQIFHLRLEKK
jgi:ribosomal protein L37AE/L43A